MPPPEPPRADDAALTAIELLGTSFTIRSSEDPAHIERALELYRKHVEAVGGAAVGRDPLKVAIVAGLNLADELVRRPAGHTPPRLAAPESIGSRDTTTADADRIAARLIQEIDRALEPEP